MPAYDVVERHRTMVRATPLMGVRTLPAALIAFARAPRRAIREMAKRHAHRTERGGAFRLADFERAAFRVVAERAPEELVIGLLGRFWTPRGGLCATVTANDFRIDPPSGHALAGWNFTVTPKPHGHAELATETRVRHAT